MGEYEDTSLIEDLGFYSRLEKKERPPEGKSFLFTKYFALESNA
jgi:hypothetical protein